MWVSFLTQGAQRILGKGVVHRNRVNCSSLMSTLRPPPVSYLNSVILIFQLQEKCLLLTVSGTWVNIIMQYTWNTIHFYRYHICRKKIIKRWFCETLRLRVCDPSFYLNSGCFKAMNLKRKNEEDFVIFLYKKFWILLKSFIVFKAQMRKSLIMRKQN